MGKCRKLYSGKKKKHLILCSSLQKMFPISVLQTQSQKMKRRPLIKSPAVPEDSQWSLDWSMFENCQLCFSCTLDVITMCYVCICVCYETPLQHNNWSRTWEMLPKSRTLTQEAHSIIIEPNKMWTLMFCFTELLHSLLKFRISSPVNICSLDLL